jgi:phosphoribosylaminoimidazole-succinocarboxamide synthase
MGEAMQEQSAVTATTDTTDTVDTTDEARLWAERERLEQVRRAQQDLRNGRQRLTEQQIALVAEVMADVRMLSIKLGR